jgi:hypothetical protein
VSILSLQQIFIVVKIKVKQINPFQISIMMRGDVRVKQWHYLLCISMVIKNTFIAIISFTLL